MRLIDADKLEEEMQNKCVGECGCCAGDCPAFIQPTAIDLVEHDKQIYNKALEDFSKKMKEDISLGLYYIDEIDLEEFMNTVSAKIKEQLMK